MFAHEHFRKFTYKEMVLVVALALISSLIIFLSVEKLDPSIAIIVSLASGAFFMNLAVYLINKSGSALIFYFLLGLFTILLDDLGLYGWQKILVYILVGIVFEIIFLVLKLPIHNLPLDMILGTSVSTSLIILFSSMLILFGFPTDFPLQLINLILVAFFTGLFSSSLVFVLWHLVANTKFVIKFKNYLGY